MYVLSVSASAVSAPSELKWSILSQFDDLSLTVAQNYYATSNCDETYIYCLVIS